MDERTIARFWSYVDKNGPVARPGLTNCWLWTRGRYKNGYGQFRPGSSRVVAQRGAHRFAWILEHGPIPDGLCVLHECDVRHCVRHLFLGTRQDNTADMVKKDRQARGARLPDQCGAANARAVLTETDVLEIRARHAKGGVSQGELAATFGVSRTLVNHIVLRGIWTHI